MSFMKAIFLAAGNNVRMRSVASQRPKCLLEVNGKALLQHAIQSVRDAGITDVVVVTGYKNALIEQILPFSVQTRHYPHFEKTNNLGTLASVADLLTGDVVIAFADVFMPDPGWRRVIEYEAGSALLVDQSLLTDGTMRVTIADQMILDVGSHISIERGDGSFTGLAKFDDRSSRTLGQILERISSDSLYRNSYYTEAVRIMLRDGHPVGAVDVVPLGWKEIDTPADYHALLHEVG